MHTNKNIASILVKLALIIGVIIGVWASLFQDGFYDPSHFLYYTIQSNLEMGIISLVCLFFLFRRNKQIPQSVYLPKFIFTVAISLTGFVFNFILYPESVIYDYYLNPFSTSNFFTHIFVPVLSIVDFFIFDYKMKITNKTFLLGLVTPLLYFGFVILISTIPPFYYAFRLYYSSFVILGRKIYLILPRNIEYIGSNYKFLFATLF